MKHIFWLRFSIPTKPRSSSLRRMSCHFKALDMPPIWTGVSLASNQSFSFLATGMCLIGWFLLTCIITASNYKHTLLGTITSIIIMYMIGMQVSILKVTCFVRQFVTWLFFGKLLNLVVFNEKTRWTPAHHPSEMFFFTRETDTNLNQHFRGEANPCFNYNLHLGGWFAHFFWVRPQRPFSTHTLIHESRWS